MEGLSKIIEYIIKYTFGSIFIMVLLVDFSILYLRSNKLEQLLRSKYSHLYYHISTIILISGSFYIIDLLLYILSGFNQALIISILFSCLINIVIFFVISHFPKFNQPIKCIIIPTIMCIAFFLFILIFHRSESNSNLLNTITNHLLENNPNDLIALLMSILPYATFQGALLLGVSKHSYNTENQVFVSINDEAKLYVYQKIDDSHILCGDNPNISEAHTRIIDLNDASQKLIFSCIKESDNTQSLQKTEPSSSLDSDKSTFNSKVQVNSQETNIRTYIVTVKKRTN